MKILCVLYDDPKDGMPTSYPVRNLPKLALKKNAPGNRGVFISKREPIYLMPIKYQP